MGGPGGSTPGNGGNGSGPGAPPVAGTQDTAATPGTQNPALRSALGQLTAMAQTAKQYAQAYPQCAPEMRQIAELLQKCLMKTTQAQPNPEPAVPPV